MRFPPERRTAALRSGRFYLDVESVQAQGLIGWWPLGIHGGDAIDKDYSQFHNPGVRSSPSTQVVRHPKLGGIRTLSFNGSSDIVTFGSSNLVLASGQPFTMSVWVNITSASLIAGAFNIGDNDTNQGPHLSNQGGSGWRFAIWGDGIVESTLDHSQDQWVHLVGTYDGTDGRLYVNGVLGGGPTAFTFTGTDGTAEIGRLNSGGSYWSGFLSDVRLYRLACPPSVVNQIYQEPLGLVYPLGMRGTHDGNNLRAAGMLNKFGSMKGGISGGRYGAAMAGGMSG